MAYTYKGTKITGTSTTAKVFKKSGVKKAKKKETYKNTTYGHIYKCTKAGEPDEAKWKYKETVIIGKPTTTVDKMTAPARDGYTYKSEWKIPDTLVNSTNGKRAEGLSIDWALGIDGTDPTKVSDTKDENATSSSINIDNLKIGSKTWKRSSFFPLTKTKLAYIRCTVAGKNSKGDGKAVSKQIDFKTPRIPTISAGSFDADTGRVTFTIETNAGADAYERYDTEWQMKVKTKTATKYDYSKTGTNTSTSFTVSYDVDTYYSLDNSQYVQIHVWARSRGFNGVSSWAEKEFLVGYPALTQIKSVKVDAKTARTTIFIDNNAFNKSGSATQKAAHKIEGVRLETIVDSSYKTAADIPDGASFTSTDVVDNGSCSALAIATSELVSDKGYHTYVRIKSWRINEDRLYRRSAWYEVKALFTAAPTAEDDEIEIIDITPGADGTSLICQIVWDDGSDASTGTELTWDTDADAWKSTREPDAYEFEWSDGGYYELTEDTAIDASKTYYTRSGSVGNYTYTAVTSPTVDDIGEYYEKLYPDSAEITIKDLDENTKYIVKARRYLKADSGTTYSGYASATALTGEIPESIVASCERFIPTGSSLLVSWTYSGNGIQTEWKITDTDGELVYVSGDGSIGSTRISADIISERAENGTMEFIVWASTGGDFVASQTMTVTMVDAPSLAVSVASPLTVQPLSFTATSDHACDLVVVITSNGISGQFADGLRIQAPGDTIYSEVFTPEWTISNDTYTTTITIPSGLDFWDLGTYTLSVLAVDRQTELQSDQVNAEFSIAWAHQAPSIETVITYALTEDTTVDEDKPYYELVDGEYTLVDTEGDEDPSSEGWYESTETAYITLTVIDETDDDEVHHQAVQIALTPPSGAASTDLYDIYRVTGDGTYLIGQSFPLTYTTTDEYAPFGDDADLRYRIAIRTVDGDEAYSDFEYALDSEIMRFDWALGSLELPYNISIADGYAKDVEIRQHMDGGIDGYWNPNITRTGSFSSSIVPIAQPSEADIARQLARYAGPVFVRLPNGTAYEADVQVSDLSAENSHIMSIAIDATEIDMTTEYMLPNPYTLEEEEE